MPRHGTHRARSSRWYLGLEALHVTPHRPLQPRLIYAGSVGAGWSIQLGRSIMAKLQRIGTDASPFVAVPRPDAKDARWTEPQLVAEVEFHGLDARRPGAPSELQGTARGQAGARREARRYRSDSPCTGRSPWVDAAYHFRLSRAYPRTRDIPHLEINLGSFRLQKSYLRRHCTGGTTGDEQGSPICGVRQPQRPNHFRTLYP